MSNTAIVVALLVGIAVWFAVASRLTAKPWDNRAQAGDVHGLSRLVDPHAYEWRAGDWKGRPWEEAVIFELHVGTFSERGTFDGVRLSGGYYFGPARRKKPQVFDRGVDVGSKAPPVCAWRRAAVSRRVKSSSLTGTACRAARAFKHDTSLESRKTVSRSSISICWHLAKTSCCRSWISVVSRHRSRTRTQARTTKRS